MAAKHVLAAGLDAGGAHTRCAILLLENACVRLIGHGEARSQGWKKSRITDQNAAAESIHAAVEQAESAAQVSIGSAVFGLGGGGIASSNARGGYEIGFPRQIDQNDINRVVERAARVQLQEDEMLLHLFPQDFTVDGRDAPLATKLGIRTGAVAALLGAPDDDFLEVTDGVRVKRRAAGSADVVLQFVTRAADLDRRIDHRAAIVHPAGGQWIAWPKRSSGVATDMSDHVVRELALPRGLVDNKVCAVDADGHVTKLLGRDGQPYADVQGGIYPPDNLVVLLCFFLNALQMSCAAIALCINFVDILGS